MKGGSSGAFVYTTYDSKYVIKTISSQEKLVLLNKILPFYIERVKSNDSAIVRVLGVFQIQCVNNYSTNLVLMHNASAFENVIAKFDLKGSTFGRKSKHGIGKDCNFIETVRKITLIEEDSVKLIHRLERDCLMLADRNLMDYSLLVTLCEGEGSEHFENPYYYRSTKRGEFYLIALIDFLQEYTFIRKVENYLKSKFYRVPREVISVIQPKIYCERFIKFIKLIT